MSKVKKKSTWHKTRKFVNDIHLWLGLISGIVLFIVCLSGTVLTFKDEINLLFTKSNYRVEISEQSKKLNAEQLIAASLNKIDGKASFISIPARPESTYVLNIKNEKNNKRGTNYYINPYTAELIGDGKGALYSFFMTTFKIHRWLLLDISIGRPIVGVATIIFTLMLISGMVIWFPKKIKHYKQGLKIKTKAKFKRINRDLHNTLGFYAFFLMLIMALSGLFWSFEWYRDGASKLLGTEVFSRKKLSLNSSKSIKHSNQISIAKVIQAADNKLEYKGNYKITLPKTETDVYTISKSKVGFFAFSGIDLLVIDQYSGDIVYESIFSQKPFNEQLVASIKALHMGYIFSTATKILYFISCLIATSLPISGTIIWINKLKKKSTAH